MSVPVAVEEEPDDEPKKMLVSVSATAGLSPLDDDDMVRTYEKEGPRHVVGVGVGIGFSSLRLSGVAASLLTRHLVTTSDREARMHNDIVRLPRLV